MRYSRPKKSLEVNWRLTLSIPDGVSSTNMQGLLDRYFGEQETDELLTIEPEERAELQKRYGKCHAKEPAHRQMNVYRLPTSVLINVVKFNCNLVLSVRVLIYVCRDSADVISATTEPRAGVGVNSSQAVSVV